MCVCECVHGRGSEGALVRSEFTVLMAGGKKRSFSLCSSSMTAEALAWPQQLEQLIVWVVRILHDPAGSSLTPHRLQVLQGGERGANNAFSQMHHHLQSPPFLRGAVAVPGSDASCDALHRTSVEGLEDPPGDSEFPQLPEVVKALLRLHLTLPLTGVSKFNAS